MQRSLLRTFVVAVTAGAMSVSVAWAGAGLLPVGDVTEQVRGPVEDATDSLQPGRTQTVQTMIEAATELDEGQLLAGASRISIEPRPEDYDAVWQTEACATMGDDAGLETLSHVPDFSRSRWPEKTDCIYMGGYGIGPMNPITQWDDEYGLHVRSVALGDGDETVVLTLIDAVYYMGRYNEMCDDCGALTIAERIGSERGIDPAGFFIAATHSHTAPDLIGGWGGVPEWYMSQVTAAIEDSIEGALDDMRPAVLEVGETLARAFNRERRRTYRSAEEPAMTWLRAIAVGAGDGGAESTHPGDANRSPRSPQRADGDGAGDEPEVIAVVGAYAAHPVTRSSGSGVGHGDWPAVFAHHLESEGVGVAMAMATGLGNISPRQLKEHGGGDLADRIPGLGTGTIVTDPDVRVAASRWTQPVTNSGLTALAVPGFFDRPFDAGPAAVTVGTHEARPCVSSSALGVTTQVSAAMIGPLLITGAPGETFSNLSNTIKESNPAGFTMPLGMTNDGLGYIIQSFETDDAARQGIGFVGDDAGFEYEDAYSIDRCFGDAVLERTLELVGQVR